MCGAQASPTESQLLVDARAYAPNASADAPFRYRPYRCILPTTESSVYTADVAAIRIFDKYFYIKVQKQIF